MSQVQQTAEEVLESLTGFDEMAIKQHFGSTVSDLAGDQTMLGRGLVFVLKRRDGLNDDDARNAALGMPLKDITSYFADESEESGKDEPSSELSPETSQPSAS
jgi:hypothetical protein